MTSTVMTSTVMTSTGQSVLVITISGDPAHVVRASKTADYELVFESTWNAQTHPTSLPPGPHFSNTL